MFNFGFPFCWSSVGGMQCKCQDLRKDRCLVWSFVFLVYANIEAYVSIFNTFLRI